MLRLRSEDQILDPLIRAQIIQEIEGSENQARRATAFKWHEIWKNKSKRYVRNHLRLLLSDASVRRMEYALSNISIARKIIDKLARVYSHGVTRKYENDAETETLANLEGKLEINSQMKTANKLLKLRRNAALYCKPVMFIDKDGNQKWRPAMIPLADYLYDVVEMENDRTKPMVFILSNFDKNAAGLELYGPGAENAIASHRPLSIVPSPGDGLDQKIADKKEDEGLGPKKYYVWWTDKYHFTTCGPAIVDPNTLAEIQNPTAEQVENPIEMKPFVDLHIDQEGHYWAEGGEDLIDGDLLINAMLTNAHHIGVTQGYGQLVLSGPNLPNTVVTGPDNSINLPTPEDATPAKAEFITANPPLDALSKQVEMYVALMLTTNNLSTSGVQASLQGGIAAPSGVALALDKAESLEDVTDQRDIFKKAESSAFKLLASWIQFFKEENMLDPEFEDCAIPLDRQPTVEFNDAQIIMSEKEKLENLQLREELGINTAVELIVKDRGCTDAEAEKILLKITEDKINRMIEMQGQGLDQDGNPLPPPVDLPPGTPTGE